MIRYPITRAWIPAPSSYPAFSLGSCYLSIFSIFIFFSFLHMTAYRIGVSRVCIAYQINYDLRKWNFTFIDFFFSCMIAKFLFVAYRFRFISILAEFSCIKYWKIYCGARGVARKMFFVNSNIMICHYSMYFCRQSCVTLSMSYLHGNDVFTLLTDAKSDGTISRYIVLETQLHVWRSTHGRCNSAITGEYGTCWAKIADARESIDRSGTMNIGIQ